MKRCYLKEIGVNNKLMRPVKISCMEEMNFALLMLKIEMEDKIKKSLKELLHKGFKLFSELFQFILL